MRRGAASAFGIALAAAPAAASTGGGEHAGAWELLFWPAVNLALLLAALVYFARKPIQAFFAKRRNQIRDELQAAANLLAESEARHAQCRAQLANLEAELEQVRALSRQMETADRERILAEVRAAAERIRTDARAAVAQELRRARELLREEAASLAVELAGERIREQVTGEDRNRLLDEFIARIEQGPGSTAGRA